MLERSRKILKRIVSGFQGSSASEVSKQEKKFNPRERKDGDKMTDIEKMEALGIYEVIPEDFGLIDYANTSKIEAQEIIREGIELMIKEVG